MFTEKKRIGILGGGQLGKMVLDVSNKWGLDVFVLDPNKNCPSSKLCNRFFEGDLMNYETVVEFGKLSDIITIEIENVNVEALKYLESLNKKVLFNDVVLLFREKFKEVFNIKLIDEKVF